MPPVRRPRADHPVYVKDPTDSHADVAHTRHVGGTTQESPMPKPERIRTVCRTCAGSGRIRKEVQAYDSKTKERFTTIVEEPCNVCGGMGFVWH